MLELRTENRLKFMREHLKETLNSRKHQYYFLITYTPTAISIFRWFIPINFNLFPIKCTFFYSSRDFHAKYYIISIFDSNVCCANQLTSLFPVLFHIRFYDCDWICVTTLTFWKFDKRNYQTMVWRLHFSKLQWLCELFFLLLEIKQPTWRKV